VKIKAVREPLSSASDDYKLVPKPELGNEEKLSRT
jgi:hypothetical protein